MRIMLLKAHYSPTHHKTAQLLFSRILPILTGWQSLVKFLSSGILFVQEVQELHQNWTFSACIITRNLWGVNKSSKLRTGLAFFTQLMKSSDQILWPLETQCKVAFPVLLQYFVPVLWTKQLFTTVHTVIKSVQVLTVIVLCWCFNQWLEGAKYIFQITLFQGILIR